jgi:hypothetical protein
MRKSVEGEISFLIMASLGPLFSWNSPYVKTKDRSISRQKMIEADKKCLTGRDIYKDEGSQRQRQTERE